MAWWIEEEPKKRLVEVYLLAYGDVFTLEQLHKSLHISEVRRIADELFHLLLDHLLVDDFPKAGVPPEITEKLKDMIGRAKSGIPEMVEILERGETPTRKEAYEKYLTGADGFLWGRIMDVINSDKGDRDILRRAGYHHVEMDDVRAKLIASITEFQKHVFRARGLIPDDLSRAKDELLEALKELEVQEKLGAPPWDIRMMEGYIKKIIEAVDSGDPALAVVRFERLFTFVAEKMMG